MQQPSSTRALPTYRSTRAVCESFDPPLHPTTLWRWVKRKKFPPPRKINGRNFWTDDDLAEAFGERKAA